MNFDYYIKRLSQQNFVIFLFHGVVNKNEYKVRNYNKKHILSKQFDFLLNELNNNGNSISMDDVLYSHEKKIRLPENSYAITFDDGFENNFSIAANLLEKHSTPATFYVSTNLIENNLMSWIDQIEYCFELENQISITLPWAKNPYNLINDKLKIDCLEDIRRNVKINSLLYPPEKIVKTIFDQCNRKLVFSSDGPLDLKMSWQQISELQTHKLFTVGGHSHNHISLGSIDKLSMENEILTSIKLLKNKSGIFSNHYSYPEGQEHDFNDSVISELIKNKIKCCPTAIDGVNDLFPESLFYLKRIMVY